MIWNKGPASTGYDSGSVLSLQEGEAIVALIESVSESQSGEVWSWASVAMVRDNGEPDGFYSSQGYEWSSVLFWARTEDVAKEATEDVAKEAKSKAFAAWWSQL